jgi:hypothetical protein
MRIWKAFDEGRSLFPADAAAELSIQAEALHSFTRHQIDRAWERLEAWLGVAFPAASRPAIENRSNITEIAEPKLTWEKLDVETNEANLLHKLQEVLNRVRFRLTSDHCEG